MADDYTPYIYGGVSAYLAYQFPAVAPALQFGATIFGIGQGQQDRNAERRRREREQAIARAHTAGGLRIQAKYVREDSQYTRNDIRLEAEEYRLTSRYRMGMMKMGLAAMGGRVDTGSARRILQAQEFQDMKVLASFARESAYEKWSAEARARALERDADFLDGKKGASTTTKSSQGQGDGADSGTGERIEQQAWANLEEANAEARREAMRDGIENALDPEITSPDHSAAVAKAAVSGPAANEPSWTDAIDKTFGDNIKPEPKGPPTRPLPAGTRYTPPAGGESSKGGGSNSGGGGGGSIGDGRSETDFSGTKTAV